MKFFKRIAGPRNDRQGKTEKVNQRRALEKNKLIRSINARRKGPLIAVRASSALQNGPNNYILRNNVPFVPLETSRKLAEPGWRAGTCTHRLAQTGHGP